MFKTLITLSFALLLTACSNKSGLSPTVSTSGFDNAKIVTITPHGNASDSMIATGIGAQWSSATPDLVLLQVAIFNDISAITGAELNIDGNKIKLYATKGITDFNSSSVKQSIKSFSTKLSVVRDIVNSEKTWVRVSTPTGSMENAIIDGETDSKAFYALQRFLLAIDSK
ncbi:MAG TPA: hypothetical protein ENH67_09220 [Pseudoalteromonas sp.]|uniref:Lipoprotein n=1 Tax=marine sediment metagenome TaxID=412755 RepID=A0A0F9NAF9_9ZZZZ|nr:hypothetical protein [Pseudoalteromonas sp.]HDY91838.1 hypothetical protein [Pseudoalteromonas sp.]HDZ33050.1 hypothetical protein [Pseudoalteromonas sp.]